MENPENKDLTEVEKKVEEHHKESHADPKGLKTELMIEKHKLLSMSEIGLWLDTYDDIFSDFDPRPYSERALSDDFLFEAKKASKEKTSGKIELVFLIPENVRSKEVEDMIRKRLHEHFRKHHSLIEEELSHARRNNYLSVGFGMLLMMGATYLELYKLSQPVFSFIKVVLEPSGWFFTWVGLDKLLYGSTDKKNDLKFYKKMTKCEIVFLSY
jgi:hypothetical protein